MKKHYREENDCLNCGTILEGKFCSNCGQENLQIKESFGHMMNHAISDYFHFDHQFFHTLKPLFFQPGKLTTEYMAGHRVQYLHPVKMYIFISVIYFLLLFKTDHNREFIKFDTGKGTEQTAEQLKAKVSKQVNSSGLFTEAQKTAINKTVAHQLDSIKKAEIVKEKADTIKTYQQYQAVQNKLPEDKRDNFITRYLEQKHFEWNGKDKDLNELMAEGMQHNVPKMMFLLLPLFALILKIAFSKSKKFYVEHLIYSFHLHCFLFLFLAMIMLLQMPVSAKMETLHAIIALFAGVVIVWYIYRSLRVVYNRSRFRTITKMLGVAFSYLLVVSVSLFLVAAITALMTL